MRHFFRQCGIPIFFLLLVAGLPVFADIIYVNGVVRGNKQFLIVPNEKNEQKLIGVDDEIPGYGKLRKIARDHVLVQTADGSLQRVLIANGSAGTSGGSQGYDSGGDGQNYGGEGYYPGPEDSPGESGEPYSPPPSESSEPHDEPPHNDQPQEESPPLPPGGIPTGGVTNSSPTPTPPMETDKSAKATDEINPGLVFSKSQIFSVSANSGPIWGDHLLNVEVRDLPSDKKIEIFVGSKPCQRLQVISKNGLTCMTPASDREGQVELSLKINGEIADILSYQYQNSEEKKDIQAAVGIPSRAYETAVFANGKIFLWGGIDKKSQMVTSGVIYDTVRDTWSMMEAANQPVPAMGAVSVFTGQEIIVWGGKTKSGYSNQGGIYNLQQKRWRKLPNLDPKTLPIPRAFATAVWTGSKMIVWGGEAKLGQRLNTGAVYDARTARWAPISSPVSFSGRSHHFAFWDGAEMKVWAGYQAGIVGTLSTIGAYNPTTNQWRQITTSLFSPRVFHRDLGWAWFTGSKLMLQGPKNSPDLGNLAWPIFYDNEIEAWPVSQTSLPALRYFPEVANKQGGRPTAIWSGRYLYIFTDGASGFRYSFP